MILNIVIAICVLFLWGMYCHKLGWIAGVKDLSAHIEKRMKERDK